MRNLFSILIFLSLAIAIGVIGRHLPEIKIYFQKKKKSSWRNLRVIGWLRSVGKKIGHFFLFLAEIMVKKFKNLLHLAHFWLIKLRKKRQKNEGLREIEAKMELLEEEEKNLEKVINEDLGQEEEGFLAEEFQKKSLSSKNGSVNKAEGDYLSAIQKTEEFEVDQEVEIFRQEKISLAKKDFSEEVEIEEQEVVLTEKPTDFLAQEDYNNKRDEKISLFFGGNQEKQIKNSLPEEKDQNIFSVGETEELGAKQAEIKAVPEEILGENSEEEIDLKKKREEKKNFFSHLVSRFKLGALKKKPEWENDFPTEQDLLGKKSEEEFSDGIVEVGEFQNDLVKQDHYQQENNLIKEVVRVKKKKEEYSDEDLGVDREILEKKIINKISLNPRDQENYRQLGDLYLKMENFRDAEECYQQVLKLKPRDLAAKRKLEKVRLLKRLRQK